MRHTLYRYFSERRWADEFLDGAILFRPLSYFRRIEDEGVRGDQNEGVSTFRPDGGLIINNITRGTTFTLPNHAFVSAVKFDEIFVLCASRSLTKELQQRFNAVACVEITRIETLCHRIKTALPAGAEFHAQPVEYYQAADSCNPRWALPEKIATSKLSTYRWQDEYRLVFSLSGALAFQNLDMRIAQHNHDETSNREESAPYQLAIGGLRDICLLHELS